MIPAISPVVQKTINSDLPRNGSLNSREVTLFQNQPLFKTWQIIVCAITVIGLFVLLGLYYKFKSDRKILSLNDLTPFYLQKKEILKDNPHWDNVVKTWQGFSIEQEVWLLQLFELRQLGIAIQIFEGLPLDPDKKILPADKDILRDLIHWKTAIEVTFKAIKEVNIKSRKCPDAICLLQNLETLTIEGDNPIPPPKVNQNQNLKSLNILVPVTSMPDISQNIKLSEYDLCRQSISTPPDLSKNINLTKISLSAGKFQTAPDLSKNLKLTRFSFIRNAYPVFLDFTANVQLKNLFIHKSNLVDISDLSQHKEFEILNASGNNWSSQAKQRFLTLQKALPKARIRF